MNLEFMCKAIEIAKLSGKDIPVGAVIVKNNNVLSCAHNQKESDNDVTAHAEIIAIKKASHLLQNWRLDDCDLYVTLEPCPMCMWAILQARIKNLYFGAFDTVYGAISTNPKIIQLANSNLKYKGGIMEQECKTILDNYFKILRED